MPKGMGKVVFNPKGIRLLVSGGSQELPIPFDLMGQISIPYSLKRTSATPFHLKGQSHIPFGLKWTSPTPFILKRIQVGCEHLGDRTGPEYTRIGWKLRESVRIC